MTRTQWLAGTSGWLLLVLLLTGCDPEAMNFRSPKNQTTVNDLKPVEPAKAEYVKNETLDAGEGDPNRGATDVAMEWADKYAKAAQELLFANQRIDDLKEENKRLQAQIATLKSELAAYQRELNDANAMLSDMKQDLKQWRAEVLGVRKEFLASQNAILNSQYRILELLGGEVSRQSYVPPAAAGPGGRPADAHKLAGLAREDRE